jgi:AcrR family transcriptional regulator
MSKGEETKKFIMDKAQELFIQKGYQTTSMNDLVEYSGVSKGSIYYHFKSKEELFLKLYERSITEWIQCWEVKEKHYQTATEKLYGVADHYIESFQNPLTKVAEEFSFTQPMEKDIKDMMLSLMKAPWKIYEKIIREGMETGEFIQDHIEDLTMILSRLLDGMVVLYYEKYSMEKIKEKYNKAISIFLRGIKK